MEEGQVEPEPETDRGETENPEETLEDRNIRVLKELEGRVEKKESDTATATAEDIKRSLSIRDRLLRRVRLKVFKTLIDVINEDEEVIDEIEIQTRMLTNSERARAIILMGELNEPRDDSTRDIFHYNKILQEMANINAEIAIDEDVRTYFTEGDATDDVIVSVLTNTLEQSLIAVGDDISRFRQKRDRTNTT